jgi:hypothetical protein
VFHLNARPGPKTGLEPAFRRNTAERLYAIEAAHNPEVAGSNPAPAMDSLATSSGIRSLVKALPRERLQRLYHGRTGNRRRTSRYARGEARRSFTRSTPRPRSAS